MLHIHKRTYENTSSPVKYFWICSLDGELPFCLFNEFESINQKHKDINASAPVMVLLSFYTVFKNAAYSYGILEHTPNPVQIQLDMCMGWGAFNLLIYLIFIN